MNPVGWAFVVIELLAGAFLVRWAWTEREMLWTGFKDASLGAKALGLFLAPLALLFAFMVAILPIAIVTDAFSDEARSDGCYRKRTEWSAATKTNQTHYDSIPCPEEVER